MKKFFTLIAMAFVAVASHAQIVFLDPEGKEYADGQTMTIYSTVDPDWGDVILEAPSIKNTSASSVSVSLNVDIKTLPENTAVQMCFPESCFFLDIIGSYNTQSTNMEAGSTRSTATEWSCYDSELDDYAYGVCTVIITAYANGNKSSAVTVNYVNADPAGINTVDANAASVVKSYDLQGRENANAKGIVIERLSNGSVRKVIK